MTEAGSTYTRTHLVRPAPALLQLQQHCLVGGLQAGVRRGGVLSQVAGGAKETGLQGMGGSAGKASTREAAHRKLLQLAQVVPLPLKPARMGGADPTAASAP